MDGDADQTGHKQSTDHHLLDPHFAIEASVQRSAKEAVDGRRHGIHENGCVEKRATPLN